MALIGYVFAATLVASECPPVRMENKTSYSWNEKDKEMVESAKVTCKESYNNSCLIRFIKIDENVYQAICGK